MPASHCADAVVQLHRTGRESSASAVNCLEPNVVLESLTIFTHKHPEDLCHLLINSFCFPISAYGLPPSASATNQHFRNLHGAPSINLTYFPSLYTHTHTCFRGKKNGHFHLWLKLARDQMSLKTSISLWLAACVTLKGWTQHPNEKDMFPELSQLFLYLSILKYLRGKMGNKMS